VRTNDRADIAPAHQDSILKRFEPSCSHSTNISSISKDEVDSQYYFPSFFFCLLPFPKWWERLPTPVFF
jgi:hypothetical protein